MITREKSLQNCDANLQHKLRLFKMDEDSVESFMQFVIAISKKYFAAQYGINDVEIEFKFGNRIPRHKVAKLGYIRRTSSAHSVIPHDVFYRGLYRSFEIRVSKTAIDAATEHNPMESIHQEFEQNFLENLWNDFPELRSFIFVRNAKKDHLVPSGILTPFVTMIHELAHALNYMLGENYAWKIEGGWKWNDAHGPHFYERFHELLTNLDFPILFQTWYDKVWKK